MAKADPETSALKEQLADALAQIDSLQTAAADAEARAATGRERVSALQGEMEAARSENERLCGRPRGAVTNGAPIPSRHRTMNEATPLRVIPIPQKLAGHPDERY